MASMNFILVSAILCLFMLFSLGVATDKDELEELETLLRELEKDEEASDEVKKVIGGTKVEEDEHPWLVALVGDFSSGIFNSFFGNSDKKYCAGTLYKRQYVLTSARCFINELGSEARKAENWIARIGELDAEGRWYEPVGNFFAGLVGRPDWSTQNMEVESIIAYPSYEPTSHFLHNIALLKLKEAVPLTVSAIVDVNLPTQGDHLYPIAGNMCWVMGWGCTEQGRGNAEYAHKGEMMVQSDSQCQEWAVSMETRLCAQEIGGGRGICAGDYGGPLMCRRSNSWYQAGLASFTSKNGNSTLFTRVSSYRNWIDEKTRG